MHQRRQIKKTSCGCTEAKTYQDINTGGGADKLTWLWTKRTLVRIQLRIFLLEVVKMLWKDVEKKYGKKMAEKMKESRYLNENTVIKNGEIDYPKWDVYVAHRDVTKQFIYDSDLN